LKIINAKRQLSQGVSQLKLSNQFWRFDIHVLKRVSFLNCSPRRFLNGPSTKWGLMPALLALASEPPLRFLVKAALKLGYKITPKVFQFASLFDAIPYTRYALGLLTAARYAREAGINGFSAVEFGVAKGNGLLALTRYAALVSQQTGLEIQVAGFDTGSGLPPPQGYRDVIWHYSAGEYAGDPDNLRKRLSGKAQYILGDVAATFPDWLHATNLPLGFVSVDVDFYSSTRAILDPLASIAAEKLLPITEFYFDDILCHGVPHCVGELAAVTEFNKLNPSRQFDKEDWIREWRPYGEKLWLQRLYALYCFDHPRMKTAHAHTRTSVYWP
jgi:hypothetical protein